MSLMCMPAQTTVPPLATVPSAAGTRASYRGEDDRRVQFLGRRFFGASCPLGAELPGGLLRLLSFGLVKAKTRRP